MFIGGQCVQEWYSLVGSVCRSDVYSHYLVENNCIETKVNCANFEEFENKFKEALVELSSVN
jgi:hypothetical protein